MSNYPDGADLDPSAPWNDNDHYYVKKVSATIVVEIPEIAVEVTDYMDDQQIEDAVREQISIKSLPSGAWIDDITIE